MMKRLRKAFTLIEVNVAILIMSVGVLALVSLFAFGFRENRQSREDVGAAVYADAVISRLVMAISSTNLKWSVFRNIQSYPSVNGWASYYDNNGRLLKDCESIAQGAFNRLISDLQSASSGTLDAPVSWPTAANSGLHGGLVILHNANSPIIRIGFRAARHPAELLSQPLYYTEARFQGLSNE
jgi:uncharacterized protein (TIGR02598 family)